MSQYTIRYSFPLNCVTHNKGSKHEFKDSMIDFYTDDIKEAIEHDILYREEIDLSKIPYYTKSIWKRSLHTYDYFVKVSKQVIHLKH